VPSPREVFVIHGRDEQARKALWGFLQAIDLHPLDWEEIVARTGNPLPFLGDVLAEAFRDIQAAVVLATPDDGASLHEDLRGRYEPEYERNVTGQARPNVLFEAGMAMALHPARTIMIEIGQLRPFSDVGGKNVIRFDGTTKSLHLIAQRLRVAECAVNTTGTDWLDTDRFAGLAAYHRSFGPTT
jgi:predicted nucleotide-binding protein